MTDRNPRGGNWLARGEDAVLSEREHRCQAEGCTTQIPGTLLMCQRHWLMLPLPIRRAVTGVYRHGRESPEFRAAAKQAIDHVAQQEGRTQGTLLV